MRWERVDRVAWKASREEIRQDLKLDKNPFVQGRAILRCSKVGERAFVFVQKASGVARLVRVKGFWVTLER